MRRRSPFLAFAVLCSVLAAGIDARAAVTVTVNNLDSAGEGFNDPTPVGPVGGNEGTTLGAQRLIAFQAAAAIWGATLTSDVPIVIAAVMDDLACNATGATLGSAGPTCAFRNFTGAPVANTWFAVALANKLRGSDLCPDTGCSCVEWDVGASFNSAVGTTCAFPKVWYYGLDGNPPSDAIDFVSVVLHEIAHGIGFLTFVNSSGTKLGGSDDSYSLNLEDHNTGKLFADMTDAERVTASVSPGALHWVGSAVVGASGALTAGVHVPSGHVEMYAPSTYDSGSSVSHFSNALVPNGLMEPFYTSAIHDLGLTRSGMQDIGWGDLSCGNGVLDGAEACDDGNTRDGDCCTSACTFVANGTTCTSADLCTSGGTCDGAGTCTGGSPTDCADANPCTDDICSPGQGCLHGPNTGPCDDDLACTATQVCADGLCAGDWDNVACALDYFKLYKSKTAKGTAALPAQTMSLLDAFETKTIVASKPAHLGLSADKNGEGIRVPNVNLECIKAKEAPGVSKFTGRRVTTSNAFGNETLDVTKLRAVCVQALMGDTEAPPQLSSYRVDNFKCYAAKTTKGTDPLEPDVVSLADAFGSKSMVVRAPALFCNPVRITQTGYNPDLIDHPDDRLVCYRISRAPGANGFAGDTVFTRNRFGAESLAVKAEQILCVPSTMTSSQQLP